MASFSGGMTPNWKEEAAKERQKKIQPILDLRCPVHNQAPAQIGLLAFDSCCGALEALVRETGKRIEEADQ
jgi:hypothetical protein